MIPGVWRAWTSARLAILGPLVYGGGVTRGPSAGNRIALTFDDGPDPAATPAILDALEAAGARATFFFLAPHIAAHPELARRAAERHEVGTHLFAHDRAHVRSREAFDAEARRALEVHERVLGARPAALRYPFGDAGRVRPDDAAAHGLTPYHWTFSSMDSSARDAGEIVAHVVPRLHAGAIVLLHDGRGPNSTKGSGPRLPTARAVPRLLEAIAARGLVATTLRELCENRHV